MIKHKLIFKDKETPGYLEIEAIEFESHYHIDMWDTRGDWHSMKPFEEVLKAWEDEVKGDPKPSHEELKKTLSYWRRYRNKRYKYSRESLFDTFVITRTFEIK